MDVIKVARSRLRSFGSRADSALTEYKTAMHCRDCEDHLEAGIAACKSLNNADEMLREADYQGVEEYTKEAQAVMIAMHLEWLKNAQGAQNWIEILRRQGYVPDNLRQFEESVDCISDRVQQLEWQSRIDRARDLAALEGD